MWHLFGDNENLWLVLLVFLLIIVLAIAVGYIIRNGWNVICCSVATNNEVKGANEYVGGAPPNSDKITYMKNPIMDNTKENIPHIILRHGYEYYVIKASEIIKDTVVGISGVAHELDGSVSANVPADGDMVDDIIQKWDLNPDVEFITIGKLGKITKGGKLDEAEFIGHDKYKVLNGSVINDKNHFNGFKIKSINAFELGKKKYKTEAGSKSFYELTQLDVSDPNQAKAFFKYLGPNNTYEYSKFPDSVKDGDHLLFQDDRIVLKDDSINVNTTAGMNRKLYVFQTNDENDPDFFLTDNLETSKKKYFYGRLSMFTKKYTANYLYDKKVFYEYKEAIKDVSGNIQNYGISDTKVKFGAKNNEVSLYDFVVAIVSKIPSIDINNCWDDGNNYNANIIKGDDVGTKKKFLSQTTIFDNYVLPQLYDVVKNMNVAFFGIIIANYENFMKDNLCILKSDAITKYNIKGNIYASEITKIIKGINYHLITDIGIESNYEIKPSNIADGVNSFQWYSIKAKKYIPPNGGNPGNWVDLDNTFILHNRYTKYNPDNQMLLFSYDKTGIPIDVKPIDKKNTIKSADLKPSGVTLAGGIYKFDNTPLKDNASGLIVTEYDFGGGVKEKVINEKDIVAKNLNGNPDQKYINLFEFQDGKEKIYTIDDVAYETNGMGTIDTTTDHLLESPDMSEVDKDKPYFNPAGNKNYLKETDEIIKKLEKKDRNDLILINKKGTNDYIYITYNNIAAEEAVGRIVFFNPPTSDKYYFYVDNDVFFYDDTNHIKNGPKFSNLIKTVDKDKLMNKYGEEHVFDGKKNKFIPLQCEISGSELINLTYGNAKDLGFYFIEKGSVTHAKLTNDKYSLAWFLNSHASESAYYVILKLNTIRGAPDTNKADFAADRNHFYFILRNSDYDSIPMEKISGTNYKKFVVPNGGKILTLLLPEVKPTFAGPETLKVSHPAISSNLLISGYSFAPTLKQDIYNVGVIFDVNAYNNNPFDLSFKKEAESLAEEEQVYLESLEPQKPVEELSEPISYFDNIDSKYSDDVQYDICDEMEKFVHEINPDMTLEDYLMEEIKSLKSLEKINEFKKEAEKNVKPVEVVKPSKQKKKEKIAEPTKGIKSTKKQIEDVIKYIDWDNPRQKTKIINLLKKMGKLKNIKTLSEEEIRKLATK